LRLFHNKIAMHNTHSLIFDLKGN